MITLELWKSLIYKLGMNKESLPENKNEFVPNQEPIEEPKDLFKGIFYTLKMKYESADLVNDKIVEITSTTGDTTNLSRILDPNKIDYFITSISKITENSPAIIFHFMTERVSNQLIP